MPSTRKVPPHPDARRILRSRDVCWSAIALVVSASTLVTDVTGLSLLGAGFVLSLLVGMLVVVPALGSTYHLAVSHPRAGGIYNFARSAIGGCRGQQLGLFLTLLFLGIFLIGASAEIRAGAQALSELVKLDWPSEAFVLMIVAGGVVPNLGGLRRSVGLTSVLVIVMLGIRWFFGLAGVFDWSRLESWNVTNLVPAGGWSWLGQSGIVAQGLALGFWAFVGIENSCTLVENVREPARSLPRGLGAALVVILLTSTVGVIGIGGALPVESWQAIMRGTSGAAGNGPHLAVGEAMFGPFGRNLMAAASVAATISTMLVALAAAPRMIMALARDGLFFGGASPWFAQTHPRTGTPWAATLLVGGLLSILAIGTGPVVECLYAAAYLWFFRYLALHVLALVNYRRLRRQALRRRHRGVWWNAVAGAGLIVAALSVSFAGRHGEYARQALAVAGTAGLTALTSWTLRTRPAVVGELAGNKPAFGIPRFRAASVRIAPVRTL